MNKKIVQSTQDSKNGKNGSVGNKNRNMPVKKKHGCRNCFLTLLVFVIVINVGGFFVGDYFAKKYIGVSAFEIVGTLNDLRFVSEKKLVTNKYTEADLTSFNNEFKKQLFLKQSAPLEVTDIVSGLLPGATKEAVNSSGNDYLSLSVHALNESGETEGANGLINTLADVFTAENLDLQRLKGYDETRHATDYTFNLTDRQIAAIINSGLPQILSNVPTDALSQFGVEKATDIIALNQIILEKSGEDTIMKATVSVKVRDIVKNFIKTSMPFDFSFVTYPFLPDKIYATAQVKLNEGAPLEHSIFINNMDGKDMDRIYRLVSGITKLAGSEMDLKKTIQDTVGTYSSSIVNVMDSLSDVSINSGNIKVDIFNALLNFSGLNKDKEEADKLSASDLILTLAGVVTSDANAAVDTSHAWDNQYYDEATDKVVYDINRVDKTNLVDYQQEFVNELAAKYMLDLKGADKVDPADDITFDDLMSLFGIGESDTAANLEILDLLDISKLGDIINNENNKVQINDRMLGAILNEQILAQLSKPTEGGNNIVADMNPKLEYVLLTTSGAADNIHNFIEMGLKANIASVIGNVGGGISDIITGLIGKDIVLVVKLDITPNAAEFASTEIRYNDLTTEQTERILKTISKFGVKLDINSLAAQIEKPVRDAINSMSSIIPIKLCNSKIDIDETGKHLPPAMEFGSVFEVIDQMLFKTAEDESINPENIENVLDGIDEAGKPNFENGADGTSGYITVPAAANYDGFKNEITSKYYLKSDSFDFDALFSGGGGLLDTATFDASNFNFSGAGGLFYDNRAASELKPIFTDAELASLMTSKMTGSAFDGLKGMEIKQLSVAADGSITIIIKLNISSFLGEGNADKLKLMPAEVVYLKANINTSEVKYYDTATGLDCLDSDPNAKAYYPTSANINNMSQIEFNVLSAMLKHLNNGTDQLNMEKQTKDIGSTVLEQLNKLKASMGASAFALGQFEVADEVNGAIKTVGGLQLMGFYDFLAKSLGLTDADPDVVKAALQGMQEIKTTGDDINNPNNYAVGEIIDNEIGGENSTDVYTDATNKSVYTTDRFFAQTFAAKMPSKEGFTLKQMSIYGQSTRGEIGNFFEDKSYTHYIAFTYEITSFTATGSKLGAVIPNKIFVTIILPYKDGTYGTAAYRINSLSATEQGIINTIVGANEDINDQIDKVKDTLTSQFAGITFGIKGEEPTKAGETTSVFDGIKFKGFVKAVITLPILP